MNKIEEYFRADVRLVWVVYSSVQKFHACESPKAVRIFTAEDVLDGGVTPPGFEMPMTRIFVADQPEVKPAA